MVSELPVYCTHRSLGCDHQCERQLLEHHLKDECPYETLPCPERKCDQFIMRKDLKSHSHPSRHDRIVNLTHENLVRYLPILQSKP